MQVTREDLNPCTVRLTVVCEPDEIKSGFDKALRQIAKKAKLPGFRPGHAPLSIVEGMVSAEELFEEAAENIFRDTYKKALESQALEPDRTTRPQVDVKKLNRENNEAEYTVKVPLAAKIELGNYKGLEVKRPRINVSDEEVNYQIEDIRTRRSSRIAVTDRGAAEGDVAVVNVKIDGEEGDGKNFMAIVGQTFPQLDEALIHMRVEEMKALELTFPTNFQEKAWAGSAHKCIVTLNTLNTVKLPALDEEFAKSLRSENMDELKGRIRTMLVKAKSQMVSELVQDQLLQALHERSSVSVSDNMWEDLANRRLSDTAEEQKKHNKTLEQYAEENGMTLQKLVESWREKAKMHIERAVIIREIFAQEKLEITNEELNAELRSMAIEYEMQPDELVRSLEQSKSWDELRFRTISNKVTNFLLNHATVTEVDSDEV